MVQPDLNNFLQFVLSALQFFSFHFSRSISTVSAQCTFIDILPAFSRVSYSLCRLSTLWI